MQTYKKVCVLCPHCQAKTDSSISHLREGQAFGPWYCHACGGGYEGVARGEQTTVKTIDQRIYRTMDLLVLPPQTQPVHFVVRGMAFSFLPDPDKEFLYHEHDCPTNWMHEVQYVVADDDTDPHGLFRFVRSVRCDKLEESTVLDVFPEALVRSIP